MMMRSKTGAKTDHHKNFAFVQILFICKISLQLPEAKAAGTKAPR